MSLHIQADTPKGTYATLYSESKPFVTPLYYTACGVWVPAVDLDSAHPTCSACQFTIVGPDEAGKQVEMAMGLGPFYDEVLEDDHLPQDTGQTDEADTLRPQDTLSEGDDDAVSQDNSDNVLPTDLGAGDLPGLSAEDGEDELAEADSNLDELWVTVERSLTLFISGMHEHETLESLLRVSGVELTALPEQIIDRMTEWLEARE